MEEEDLLNDIDFGEHNNKPNSIVWKNYYDDNRILYCTHPNGETFNGVYNRMEKFMEKYKNEKYLIFATHGCCFAILENILSNRQKSDFTRKNLIQISQIKIEYKYEKKKKNNANHKYIIDYTDKFNIFIFVQDCFKSFVY